MNLPFEIEVAVQKLMAAHGGIGSVAFLEMPRLVPDYVDKAIVFTPRAKPALLVMIAPPAYPDCVRDAFQRADAARRALGEGTAGAAVQVALARGVAQGQSYAVVPYLTPTGRGRFRRRWDGLRLRAPALEWLRDITRRTAQTPPEKAQLDAFMTPLLSLSQMEAVGERVREAARDSLRALEAGRWQPRWVLAHNDLWLGNFLRRRSDAAGIPGFAVIDWGASQVRGYPVYDLLAFAPSVGLSTAALRRELRDYCAALGCEPGDAKHHLMAALGGLSLALGEWPVERFAATAQHRLGLVESAQ
jgi:hypothetical protein